MRFLISFLMFLSASCFAQDGWYISGESATNIAIEHPVFLNQLSSGVIVLTHPYSKYTPCYKTESVKVLNVNDVDVNFVLKKNNKTCLYSPKTEAGVVFLKNELLEPKVVFSDLIKINNRAMPVTFSGKGYIEALERITNMKSRKKNAL